LLLQVPSWAIVVALGAVGVRLSWFGLPVAFASLAAWVVKDLIMYPVLRPHLFRSPQPLPRELEGRTGVVLRALNPEGYVKVSGQRWKARASSDETLEEGGEVEVVGLEDLTLIVSAKLR
jgi:membrane protein implicated in regulation of membrane protease activity